MKMSEKTPPSGTPDSVHVIGGCATCRVPDPPAAPADKFCPCCKGAIHYNEWVNEGGKCGGCKLGYHNAACNPYRPPTSEPPTAQIVDEFYKANPHLTIQAEPPKPAEPIHTARGERIWPSDLVKPQPPTPQPERHAFVGHRTSTEDECTLYGKCHRVREATICARPASDPVHEVTR